MPVIVVSQAGKHGLRAYRGLMYPGIGVLMQLVNHQSHNRHPETPVAAPNLSMQGIVCPSRKNQAQLDIQECDQRMGLRERVDDKIFSSRRI